MEVVGQLLKLLAAELVDLLVSEPRQHVFAHGLLVAVQRRRLVAITRTGADQSRPGALEPLVPGLP